jgi:hypothetical protein
MVKKPGLVLLFAFALLSISLAEAQQPKKIPRVGVLTITPPSSLAPRINAFREALHQLGYVEGHNIAIEYRHAEGKRERLSAVAAELVREKAPEWSKQPGSDSILHVRIGQVFNRNKRDGHFGFQTGCLQATLGAVLLGGGFETRPYSVNLRLKPY